MSSAKSDSEQPARHWRLFPRTFRVQVTAWNTLTILLFAIAILIGLRTGLTWMMLQEEDKLLSEDAAEVALFVERFAPEWDQVRDELERKAESHEPRKWFGLVRDLQGSVLAESAEHPPVSLPAANSVLPRSESVESFRLSFRRMSIKSGRTYVIIVGATTEEIQENVDRLTRLIVFAALLLMVLAPLGGFWLAGRVIQPLANIISTTAGLRPSNIHERLPTRQTGDELDQLSITINGFLDRIADYLARHRDLTANAAHELRSPLAAIMNSAEVALNQPRSPEEYQELLASIIEECTRLGTLVQQLLLLAESDAGRLERKLESVSLDRLAERAGDMFRGVAEAKGVLLEVSAPNAVWVVGDSGFLQQVVFNLVDNALKFTPAGTVRINVRETSEGRGILSVRDSGIGIPPESLPHVFDRFYRGDHARTRLSTGGSGLGLSICKALIGASGGEISVSSDLGHGTEVCISLPIDRNRNHPVAA